MWSSLAIVILMWASVPVWAQAQETYSIAIKGHHFDPPQLTVPANQKIELVVDNQDPTEEEFESFDLDREEVVEGGKKVTLYLGPLKKGIYKYYGDFNPKTAQGSIVAQ